MTDIVRVCDINPAMLEGPYAIRLARAVSGRYLENGAQYLAIHAAPRSMCGEFFMVVTIDETSADHSDYRKKFMVEGGTQYGCSARTCPFCPFSSQLRIFQYCADFNT